jgi:DNA replication factor GINS
MTLPPTEIDKIYSDLQSAVRVEKNSKRIRKIEPKFYSRIVEALDSLEEESIKQAPVNIDEYIAIKQRKIRIEHEFNSLFQLRFSKILRLAVYDMDDELSQLIETEKEFLSKVKTIVKAEYSAILNGTKHVQEKQQEKPPSAPEIGIIQQDSAKYARKDADDYVLIRIIGDQPPIAMPERNYYLRDNDLVHLRKKFADLLINRKIAVKAEIPDNK